MSSYSYELSQKADDDLTEIFDYTIEHYGMDQAVKYFSGFESLFESLCLNPKTGRIRNDIRKELRSISYISHTVYYRIMPNKVRIIRILHSSRDVIRFLH